MVTGESQHGVDTEGGSGENVAQNGHTVPVPASHLQNGFQTSLFQVDAQAQRGSLQAGRLHIRDVNAVDLALQKGSGFQMGGKIVALRRRHLRRNGELTAL